MVWVPGGEFTMGSDRHYPEEAPVHRVAVDGFWMDRGPVTNHEFAAFVAATGYRTVAERPPEAADYPGADPALLVPASAVFTPPAHRVDLSDPYRWWSSVPGAEWRHPRGPASSVVGLGGHPVVHVAWDDAAAYAAWAGKVLPTEAEWELAARGGLEGAEYAWGAELTPAGRHLANVWQGEFPRQNLAADGFEWTSPVGAFPPNGFGLLDMIGNVWEWTADWWTERRHLTAAARACCGAAKVGRNPVGGRQALSVDPGQPLTLRVPRKSIKGGSYLCAPNYCRRYRPAARLPQAVETSTGHLGFRCVVRGWAGCAGG
jgi:formylglycine-generating enzyme required for sulfatase activity